MARRQRWDTGYLFVAKVPSEDESTQTEEGVERRAQ